MNEEMALPFDRNRLFGWMAFIFMAVIVITGFSDTSSFSASAAISHPTMFWVPALISFYLVVIFGLRFIGLEPNRFEMVFLPGILIIMILLSLTLANMLPDVSPEEDEGGSQTSNTNPTDQEQFSEQSSDQGVGGEIEDVVDQTRENLLVQFASYFSLIIIISLFAYGILRLMKNRAVDYSEIEFVKEMNYSTPMGKNQSNIMKYYIDSSITIEEKIGMAPIWLSPTRFSSEVTKVPGPPLASYFDKLTNLYEHARFSDKSVTQSNVDEAKDLHLQVKENMKKFNKNEDN